MDICKKCGYKSVRRKVMNFIFICTRKDCGAIFKEQVDEENGRFIAGDLV